MPVWLPILLLTLPLEQRPLTNAQLWTIAIANYSIALAYVAQAVYLLRKVSKSNREFARRDEQRKAEARKERI